MSRINASLIYISRDLLKIREEYISQKNIAYARSINNILIPLEEFLEKLEDEQISKTISK